MRKRYKSVILFWVFFGGGLGDSGRQRNNTPLTTDFPPTHLMRRWSLAPTPCWRCFQMCRDLQTREDGDVANNTAADKKSQSQLSTLPSRAKSVARRGKKGKRTTSKEAPVWSGCRRRSDAQPSRVASFITNTISPLAGPTIYFDWVNLYQHNSHYDPAKCQWRRPCCDRLFRGLLKPWHFLTNDCVIWVEGEAHHWTANWFNKRCWFIFLWKGVPMHTKWHANVCSRYANLQGPVPFLIFTPSTWHLELSHNGW